MSTATNSYNTAAKAAWEKLRDARAESLSDAQAHAAQGTYFYAKLDSGDTKGYLADKGAAEKALADAILTAKTTLANDNGTTEKNYITTVAPLDAAYQVTLAQADNVHRYASTSATTAKNRDVFIADAARREDQAAARGIYETASYQAYAATKASIAAANPSPRTQGEADSAAADAIWANAVRIARDAYEDTVSVAGLNQINAITTAELTHIGSINSADDAYTNTVACNPWARTPSSLAC